MLTSSRPNKLIAFFNSMTFGRIYALKAIIGPNDGETRLVENRKMILFKQLSSRRIIDLTKRYVFSPYEFRVWSSGEKKTKV